MAIDKHPVVRYNSQLGPEKEEHYLLTIKDLKDRHHANLNASDTINYYSHKADDGDE